MLSRTTAVQNELNFNENCKVTGLYAYLSLPLPPLMKKFKTNVNYLLITGTKSSECSKKIQFHFFHREGVGPQNPRDQLRKR